MTPPLPKVHRRRFLQGLVGSSLPLLTAAAAGHLMGQEPLYRSVEDRSPRLPDRLDRPAMPERATHRGFEARTPQFVVVAMTSMEDARWGAAQLTSAWQEMGQLANHWTTVHQQANFGIGALQLVINNEPLRDQDKPATTVNVVGIETQVQINVGNGQPSLAEQLPRLREGATLAFLHTAEFDRQFPEWVNEGLAAYIGSKGLVPTTHLAELAPAGERLGGSQWRYQRKSPDTLDTPPSEREQAGLAVRYFLEGNDAQLAPAFLASLRQTAAEAWQFWAQEPRLRTRGTIQQLDKAERSVETFAANYQDDFLHWLKNPDIGQPIVELASGTSGALAGTQRAMAVVLKLARRFAKPTSSIQTRITSFDPKRGVQVEAQPLATHRTVADLYFQLTAPSQPEWATLDASGQLLFSSDRTRLRQILGIDENRYRTQTEEGRWVLTEQLGSGRSLRGWLEENPDDKTRPLARFAQTDNRAADAR